MWEWIGKYWLEALFGAIVAGLSAAYARLAKKFKAEKKKNEAIENGLRGLLRMQILDTYDKCVSDGRKISVSRKDAVVSIYQSYVGLGKPGETDDTINNMYEEIVHMTII
jgi:hypothetical protein